jgi:serine protease Do
VILRLNGKVMENGRQFDVNLYRSAIGKNVTVEVERATGSQTFNVAVIEREGDPARFYDLVHPDKNLVPKLGILAVDITAAIKRMLPPLRREDGVVVAARSVDSPLASGGLLAGDVIHSINGRRVRDLSQLQSQMHTLRTGDAAVCQIERNGRLQFVALEIDI